MTVRRTTIEIIAPLGPNTKRRLIRGVARALVNPARSLPTLRGNVLIAATELRQCRFSDERIHALFAKVIEDVARGQALDETSLLTRNPRWVDLAQRVNEWVD